MATPRVQAILDAMAQLSGDEREELDEHLTDSFDDAELVRRTEEFMREGHTGITLDAFTDEVRKRW